MCRLAPTTFVDASKQPSHPGAPLKDKTFPGKLKAETPGILQWIVDGCVAWQRDGLDPPRTVQVATAEYREESNTLGQWLDDRCVRTEDSECRPNVAYHSYRDWCSDVGESPLPVRAFSAKLREMGIERKRRADGQHYRGFTIPVTDFEDLPNQADNEVFAESVPEGVHIDV
jgi:putative DNA primase/helicase